MITKRIEKLLIKYLNRSTNASELDELNDWISNTTNLWMFKEYVKLHYNVTLSMNDPDLVEIQENLLAQIQKDNKDIKKSKVRRLFSYTAVCAVLVLLSTTFYLQESDISVKTNSIQKVNIVAGSSTAILTLENGESVELKEGNIYKNKNVKSTGSKLKYDMEHNKSTELVYNTLTVPKGGQFFVALSDGTKVWLNSESKLRFPVKFTQGEVRKIELVYGEAYLDVTSSNENSGSNFIVISDFQEIEVLGTEFNIKAYKDENKVTTLVEGAVRIGNGLSNKTLKPNEQSIIDLRNKNIKIQTVERMFDVVSWKEGYFSFRQKKIREIMKILSRWYSIDVVVIDPNKEDITFTGVLDRTNGIEQILEYIQLTNEIKYEINDKKITIN